MTEMKVQILIKNGTAAKWTAQNPVLGKGEMGLETDTRKFKFGDGVKKWNELDYASNGLELLSGEGAPAGATATVQGQVYYDTTGKKFYISNGTEWSRILDGSDNFGNIKFNSTGGYTFDVTNKPSIDIKNGDGVKITDNAAGEVTIKATTVKDTVNSDGKVVTGMTTDADTLEVTPATTEVSKLKLQGYDETTNELLKGTDTLEQAFNKVLKNTENNYAKLSGATFTGKVNLRQSTNEDPYVDTEAVPKKYVDSILQANDAMVFKGVLEGAEPTPGAFTPAASTGHTYKVGKAGYINGIAVEVGDTFICTADNVAVATADNYTTINDSWVVLQVNIDSAVTAVEELPAGQLVVGKGGKSVKALANGSNGQVLYINNGELAWTDLAGGVPVASNTELGKVMGTEYTSEADANTVSVDNTTGKMTVNKVDVSNVFVKAGDTLILNGGTVE